MEFKRFKSENPVWGCFLRSRNGDRAKRETCENTISCKGESTGAMRNHLCLKHKILLETKKAKQQVSLENANKSSTGTSMIKNYFKPTKESLKRIVAELAAVNRISFNTVSTSKQLLQAFLARGYKLPQTVQNVRKYYHIFFPNTEKRYKGNDRNKKRGWKILFCHS